MTVLSFRKAEIEITISTHDDTKSVDEEGGGLGGGGQPNLI